MFGSRNKARKANVLKNSALKTSALKTSALKNRVMAHTLISAATQLQGDLRFEGELIVEGHVTGDINAADDSDAVLRVAEHGVIEGEIRVPNVVINGTVKGDIHASGHIELAARALITGDVHYQLIEMVMGARVNGSLLCQSAQAETQKALTYQQGTEDEPDAQAAIVD